MGSVWLRDLDKWLTAAGLNVSVYDDQWKNRSRSSGGYEAVRGIGIHHDASSIGSSEKSACDWGWKNSSDKPIGCIRLARDGHITVGAAGATNTMGKGGPLTTSRGTIPKDQGNLYMVAIEAANNGVGETWGRQMMDAYIAMVWALCEHLDLQHSDVFGHAGYCQPSCPGRKIDPAGPASGYPNLGGTSGAKTWPDSAFRSYLDAYKIPPGPTPPPANDWPTQGAAMTTPPGTPILSKGMVHANVPWLQAVLCSMPKLAADGGGPIFNPDWVGYDTIAPGPSTASLFGQATADSLNYWKSRNSLPSDSRYDTATANAMYKVRKK